MPYKVFTAGEEALAADVNNYLMSQTVSRHASASARTAAIASPTKGQMTVLDTDVFDQQVYTGSAWASMPWSFAHFVHQTGYGPFSPSVNVTLGLPAVTFPRACSAIWQLQVYVTRSSGTGGSAFNFGAVTNGAVAPTTAPLSAYNLNPFEAITIPITAFFRNVAAGANFAPGINAVGGGGGVTIDIGAISGWVTAFTPGSEF
jgi:hypothetical protein